MADFRQTEFTEPPTIQEIERQVRWEVDAVERAVKRYRQEQRDAVDIGSTSAGQKLLREAMGELTEHIRDTQESLEGVSARGATSKNEWWLYVCLVDPGKLAYLTLRALLGEKPSEAVTGRRKLTLSCKSLIRMIELEVSFQDWVQEDRVTAKEAKTLGAAYQRQLDAFKRRNKKVDARSVKRWFAKLQRAWKQPWPESQKFALGGALIKWAVEHGAGLFTIERVPRPGGKTELYATPTPRAQVIMEDHDARSEVAKPFQRPMLCQPKQWQWEPAQCLTQVATTSTIARSLVPA